MKRKQIYITVEQEKFLKDRHLETGLPESEMIRTAIDKYMDSCKRKKKDASFNRIDSTI